MSVTLREHPVRGEWHIQRNANREPATLQPLQQHVASPSETQHYSGKNCPKMKRKTKNCFKQTTA